MPRANDALTLESRAKTIPLPKQAAAKASGKAKAKPKAKAVPETQAEEPDGESGRKRRVTTKKK